MSQNDLFNISESVPEDTANFMLNQPPRHLGDSVCEEEIDDNEFDINSYPGEPFINKLQRSYKTNKFIPIELLSTLSADGMKHLIEVLINDTLNLKNLKEGKKTPPSSDSESENYRLSQNFSTNSFSKQPTFPLSRPIAREELKMRRNNNLSTYQKVQVIRNPVESISISPIAVKLPEPEQYDQTVLKLCHEIAEAKNTKNMFMQLIRLSPTKLKISTQASSILAKLSKHKQKFNTLVQETGKLKIYSQLTAINNRKRRIKRKPTYELKDEEIGILQSIIKSYDSQNLKNFRENAFGLMREYEANEVTALLVKHTCSVEIKIFGNMLLQIACMKQVLELQENTQNEIVNDNNAKANLIRQLQAKIKNGLIKGVP